MKYLSIVLLISWSVAGFAQQETFDLITYTIPVGWKKNSHTDHVISYAATNNQKGTYCQIGIYKSTNSKGSLQADFESEWQELVVKAYHPTQKPELVPRASENGWDAQGGAAPFEFSGGQSAAMLVTMTGYGRCTSIVILMNTKDYQTEIEKFLKSVDLKRLETTTPSVQPAPEDAAKPSLADKQSNAASVKPAATGTYQFATTTFDDGWTSTVQEDWVQVVKGSTKVLIHYPAEKADAYNSVVLDGLKNAWNVLVAPKYSSASNFEFKPISGWQTIEFAEADAVEKTGRSVHVVLFKMNYANGSGKYLEFITPDKKSFEQEFGAYHQNTSGWEKMESMANYNKFAVGAADLAGKWTTNFSGMVQYVNANTGADAGANTHASSETFRFTGDTYSWELGVASGMVGNIKFQSAKATGKFSLTSNWQLHFSDIEGKPKDYPVQFTCLKGARLLWIGDTAFAKTE
jgi:hypothetical protein